MAVGGAITLIKQRSSASSATVPDLPRVTWFKHMGLIKLYLVNPSFDAVMQASSRCLVSSRTTGFDGSFMKSALEFRSDWVALLFSAQSWHIPSVSHPSLQSAIPFWFVAALSPAGLPFVTVSNIQCTWSLRFPFSFKFPVMQLAGIWFVPYIHFIICLT